MKAKFLRDIISRNCHTKDNTYKLKVIIYYKDPKISSLVIRNNITTKKDMLSKTNVIYQYKCPSEDCAPLNVSYIGQTTCTVGRRLTYHLQSGAIKQYHQQCQRTSITRDNIISNTTILTQCFNPKKLEILEVIHIRDQLPHINIQMNCHGKVALFDDRQQGTLDAASLQAPPLALLRIQLSKQLLPRNHKPYPFVTAMSLLCSRNSKTSLRGLQEDPNE